MSDAENDEKTAGGRRTPPSLHLLRTSFDRIRVVVKATADLGAPESKAVIAQSVNMTAQGGAWNDRWGGAQYCGFVQRAGSGKFEVTNLGRRFVSDNEQDARLAAQEGFARSGFGTLLNRFNVGRPTEQAIAAVLVGNYSVPDKQAEKAAKDFLAMAEECGLLSGNRFQAAELERAREAAKTDLAAAPAPPPHTDDDQGDDDGGDGADDEAPVKKSAGGTGSIDKDSEGGGGGGGGVPFGMATQVAGPMVVLNVDATKLTAAELGELVRELRRPPDAS